LLGVSIDGLDEKLRACITAAMSRSRIDQWSQRDIPKWGFFYVYRIPEA
jgi:hypothetical protein